MQTYYEFLFHQFFLKNKKNIQNIINLSFDVES
jgi:hypothetical protein